MTKRKSPDTVGNMLDFNDTRLAIPNDKTPLRGQVRTSRLKLIMADDGRMSAECVSSVFYGETVDMYSNNGEYALIRSVVDHYVGWVPMKGLGEVGAAPTHRIIAPLAYAYSAADLKSAPRTTLFQNSFVVAGERSGKFVECEQAGWVPEVHLTPLDTFGDDPAETAIRLAGAPYLWGGRDLTGIDCSGLTQLAFADCGLQLPRDSDMQYAWCGEDIAGWDSPGGLQRNDLVFWKGHVGIMLDAETLFHANAHHMSTVWEPLDGAIERIASYYGEPIGARRIALDGSNCQNWYQAE